MLRRCKAQSAHPVRNTSNQQQQKAPTCRTPVWCYTDRQARCRVVDFMDGKHTVPQNDKVLLRLSNRYLRKSGRTIVRSTASQHCSTPCRYCLKLKPITQTQHQTCAENCREQSDSREKKHSLTYAQVQFSETLGHRAPALKIPSKHPGKL